MPDTKLLFAGQVAAVTGAGKGLGRAYALWLGQHGCAVVVKQVMGADLAEMIKPDRIAPVVGWLCTRTNAHRGHIFHASSLRTSRIGIVESVAVAVDPLDVAALNLASFSLEQNFEPVDSAIAVGRLLGG
jgi:NAD(P)-dependent dehydrogenase (short-subunit alcohol dehydrogenase family)